MMNRNWALAGGVAAATALTGACGDSTSGGGGSTSSIVASASASSGQGGAGALTCDFYCSKVMPSCLSQNQQYLDLANCLSVCASFSPGALDDQKKDTLGCRVAEAGFVKVAPDTKCAHAGPSGGDLRGSQPGICGDGCEAFCNLEPMACTGAQQQYASASECMTACAAFPGQMSSDDFDTGDVKGNTFNCRLYHAVAAASDPLTHCPHTKPSATADPCTGP
jgi:hypothetical protein